MERAEDGARHFESPAMQMAINAQAANGHDALDRLVDRSRIVGIRVFTPDRNPIYETWGDVPAVLIDAARSRQHGWPGRDRSHRNWIEVSGERLTQIVLPLFQADGSLAGYLEGVSRLDKLTLEAQTEQVRNGALTASVSVLITALLLSV